MKVARWRTDTRGHVWKLDADGEPDDLAVEIDIGAVPVHRGPVCALCGYTFCLHCEEEPDEDCPGLVSLAK